MLLVYFIFPLPMPVILSEGKKPSVNPNSKFTQRDQGISFEKQPQKSMILKFEYRLLDYLNVARKVLSSLLCSWSIIELELRLPMPMFLPHLLLMPMNFLTMNHTWRDPVPHNDYFLSMKLHARPCIVVSFWW